MNHTFRLVDFNISNKKLGGDDEEDLQEEDDDTEDTATTETFNIQMFGLNEQCETCSIIVEDFSPFFYVKVPPFWTNANKSEFHKHLADKMGFYYKDTIVS